jgi:hypothetical protein
MLKAIKKMISLVLILTLVSLPSVLSGCAEDEIHTRQEIEVKEKVVSQETVVE